MAPTRTSPSKPFLKQTTLQLGGPSSTTKKALELSSSPPAPVSPSKKGTKSKSRKPDPDRVESDVLLSILPVHLANIASRQKNHEYRKYRLRDGVERLWFYETKGDDGKGPAAITHIATIPSSVRHEPGQVPEEPFGIGNKDFNDGKKVSKYGYPILELYELVKPLTLAEMKAQWGSNAPMGWCYLKRGMWESRWGDEQGDDKVKKLF